jgi:general secretion pathway protein F/type IV pilus assembly protein PilC
MGLFRYQALSAQGKKVSGVIDADSFVMAKERLRKEQVMVTRLEALADKRKEIALPPSLLLDFTRALGQLLRAGLPLYESLVTLEEKYKRHKAHPLFLDLCDRLKCGVSLSEALKKYPKTFDEIYVCMVKSAEQTGSLPSIFEQLTMLISRQHKLKKQLVSAMIYPAFLGGFCLVVVSMLFFFVIPSMSELFEGRQLHPLTHIVLSMSRFVNAHGILLLAAIASFISLTIFAVKRKASRIYMHQLALKVPFLKTLTLEASLIRFCRCSSILLTGGIPLLEALRLSRKVMNNILLEGVIEKAAQKVVEGRSLTSELKNSPLIPAMVIRMLAISEETGKVAPMLHNIADIYEEELEKNLTQLTTLLQPALLLLLGLIVGVVLLSILIPLTDVGSMIQT